MTEKETSVPSIELEILHRNRAIQVAKRFTLLGYGIAAVSVLELGIGISNLVGITNFTIEDAGQDGATVLGLAASVPMAMVARFIIKDTKRVVKSLEQGNPY